MRITENTIFCFDIGGTLLAGSGFATSIQQVVERTILRDEWNTFFNFASGPVEQDLSSLAQYFRVDYKTVKDLYASHRAKPAKLYPDVLPTLQALIGYRCIALSNVASWLLADSLCGAEKYLSALYYSYEIRLAKPDIQAFRFIEQALSCESKDLVMIGDSLSYDYLAALNAGWNAILLDRDGRYSGGSLNTISGLGRLIDVISDRQSVSSK